VSYVVVTAYQPPGDCEPIVNVYATSAGTKAAANSLAMRIRRRAAKDPHPGRLRVFQRRVVEAAETVPQVSEVRTT
jgi:hypothetical protein